MMSPLMQFQMTEQHRQDMERQAEKQRLANILVQYLKQAKEDEKHFARAQDKTRTDELPSLRLNPSGSM